MTNYLLPFALVISLGTTTAAFAQTPLMLFNGGRALGRLANHAASARPVTIQEYGGRHYTLQRTTAAQLPPHEAELVTAVESPLEDCRTAMLGSPTAPVCSPEQSIAIHNALANLVRARLHWSIAAYEEELKFYVAEDAYRQAVATPAK